MTNSTLNAEYKTFRGQAIKEIGTDDKDSLILTLNKSIKYMKLFRVCLIFVGDDDAIPHTVAHALYHSFIGVTVRH